MKYIRNAAAIAAVLALGLAPGVAAAYEGKCTASDLWRGPDKTKHAIAGAAIGAGVTYATKEPLYGGLAATAVGALKEAVDRRSPDHTCSFQDFAVTAGAGWAAAYGTAWFVLPKRNGGVQVVYSKAF